MIERLALIGVGLIGGSLAYALREAGYIRTVMGAGRHETNLKDAVKLGVIDRYTSQPAQAVKDADMVVLAVPLGAVRAVLTDIKDTLDDTAILTDVGSVKVSVINDAQAVFSGMPERFVPGHPIAGTEKSGVHAAFASLFKDRRVVLTPVAETADTALMQVRRMWEAAGAMVETMDAHRHDRILAATSHLPHMLAFALMDHLRALPAPDEVLDFAGGGLRDLTRIAASDAVMWRDICLANQSALIQAMKGFQCEFSRLQAAIEQGDGQVLAEVFQRAKATREGLPL